MIEFEVLGKPQGKARPRINTYTKRAYTPKKTIEYENLVQSSYKLQYSEKDKLDGAITARIFAVFEVPKSYSKKRRQKILDTDFLYTSKPDGDNIAKAILDSLNGLAFEDDAQIVDLRVVKIYGEEAKVRVVLDKYVKE